MTPISEGELQGLGLGELVDRMDQILASPYWQRFNNQLMSLKVMSLFETKVVRGYSQDIQRIIVNRAFQFLLQLLFSEFAISAQFFRIPTEDDPIAEQIHAAARRQWFIVSSSMVFENFKHLIYILGNGKDLSNQKPKSTNNRFKTWLKEKNNPYAYFVMTIVRANKYNDNKRTSEVHKKSSLAQQILRLSANVYDNTEFNIINDLKNQWQHLLIIANGSKPSGWVISGKNPEEYRRWYEIYMNGSPEEIQTEILTILG